MSSVRNLQSGSLEDRREGVSILTKEQQVSTSFIRIRPNSNDLLIYSGKRIDDNFFDENLFDSEGDSITHAPSNFAEKRTLGQSENVETTFTDLSEFDPIAYIQDDGLAMFPSVLIAQGYADPIVEDGTMGIFETRKEIVGLQFAPDFAKRGAKASLCSTAESIEHKFYQVEQSKPRNYESSLEKSAKYVEAANDNILIETTTYQDQTSANNRPFVDDYDGSVTLKLETGSYSDPDIASVILSGKAGCSIKSREVISSTAGWTFLNNVNGTDSIVYSDRT